VDVSIVGWIEPYLQGRTDVKGARLRWTPAPVSQQRDRRTGGYPFRRVICRGDIQIKYILVEGVVEPVQLQTKVKSVEGEWVAGMLLQVVVYIDQDHHLSALKTDKNR
jgi:hypothetical protein